MREFEGGQSERRRRRSPWASEALHLQLLQAVNENGIDAMVLSDSLGQLWAASSRAASPGAIAARVGRSEGPELLETEHEGTPVVVRRFSVGPTTLFLSAQGPLLSSRSAVEHATPGVSRILGGLLR